MVDSVDVNVVGIDVDGIFSEAVATVAMLRAGEDDED